MKETIQVTTLGAAVLALAGCASVVVGTTQTVRVDAKTEAGEPILGAACVAFNDRGSTQLKSGTSEVIHRSAADMHFVCTHPGLSPALGTATSRGNGGIAGNLIIGGVLGAVIDHTRGAAYTYPTWIKMEFGKALMFDRHFERSGQPLEGYVAGSPPPALPPTARPTSLECMQRVGAVRC